MISVQDKMSNFSQHFESAYIEGGYKDPVATFFLMGMEAAIAYPEWSRALLGEFGCYPLSLSARLGMEELVQLFPMEVLDD